MKTITCPPLCGIGHNLRGDAVEWGVVEYIQDILLPQALTSAELCDLAIRLSPMLKPLRGTKQVGAQLTLSDDDCGALQRLVRGNQRQPGGPEDLVAFATCNRAILLAETVKPAQQAAE